MQEAWPRTICIAIHWIVLWLGQGSAVLQYSHCSGDTARRSWAGRAGAGLGVQALGGRASWRRAQALALGRARGARTSAGLADGQALGAGSKHGRVKAAGRQARAR